MVVVVVVVVVGFGGGGGGGVDDAAGTRARGAWMLGIGGCFGGEDVGGFGAVVVVGGVWFWFWFWF